MTKELFILFATGILLCLIAYFIPKPKWLKIALSIIGGLLIALPFVLLIYFIAILF